jgi:hypothetical protein
LINVCTPRVFGFHVFTFPSLAFEVRRSGGCGHAVVLIGESLFESLLTVLLFLVIVPGLFF